MPTRISMSLTTADTRAYIYPPDVKYVIETPGGGILYTLDLMPDGSLPPE